MLYNCILVSLDGSLAAEAVLPEVERILKTSPCKVVLLKVGPHFNLDEAAHEMEPTVERAADLPADEYDLLTSATELEIRRYLDAIAERLKLTGATPVVEVSFTKPVEEILFFAKQYQADLIAMATHGRTGLNRLLHGSVTENVLHHAPCPMLVIRSPEAPTTRFVAQKKEMAV